MAQGAQGRLNGRTALITGAGSGIGREAARLFAAEGANVVVADIDDRAGEETAAAIAASGARAHFVHTDVGSAAQVESAVGEAERTYGALHVLFNNAGIFLAADGSPVDTPEDVWDRVIGVNLKGVFLGCKFGIPALLRAGGGSIVNTASFVAVLGAATSQIAYTASKGGVLALAPFPASPLEVVADRRLRDGQFLGDGGLRPALQVQVGHRLPAFEDGERLAAFNDHGRSPPV